MSVTWVTAKGSGLKVLTLYRHILKRAHKFPSVKRNSIIEDIRVTFRENRAENDPEKLQLAIDNAVNGLIYLEQYTKIDKNTPNWSLGLIGNPIQDPSLPPVTLNELLASGKSPEIAQIAAPDQNSVPLLSGVANSGNDPSIETLQASVPTASQAQHGESDLASAAASVRSAWKRKKHNRRPS